MSYFGEVLVTVYKYFGCKKEQSELLWIVGIQTSAAY
jgi:hypothetical protein